MKFHLSSIIQIFFVRFNRLFRSHKIEAFEAIMILAISHAYGCFNPKQLADFLGVNHQKIYAEISSWTLYKLQKVLKLLMVNVAVEQLQIIEKKSNSTQSRAKITFAVDDSVIDRVGKRLRCTFTWYSGRWKKVVNGQNILGIILTINGKAIPIGLKYCSKQGRKNTDKPSILIAMLKEIKEECLKENINISKYPITLDSWYVSKQLKEQLDELGFTKIIMAGKSSYVFEGEDFKGKGSEWKKRVDYQENQWGIDVPCVRKKLSNPTFGELNWLFFQKSNSSCYLLMDLSSISLRGVEIWRIWSAHNIIEQFWKMLKSVLKIAEMKLRKQGIYIGLLIKVIMYLILLSMQFMPSLGRLSLTQIMRKIESTTKLPDVIKEHFQHDFLGVSAMA
ncbi:hypothetical protein [Cyanobacterium sp. Dongsha4]|uniref:hypothetical protein n=1 Tax=Cyanobacterium sp. DS4 TaxID=2878255 RepID=UPI002E807E9D|nr:hypothetical protein [Cyanobacterium sp. Dongsha4]WVL00253.1 hypothetical protein Dongsha4_16615 [Cyanobacterium sp. Dongsha4]WVL02268.1 hypothetical protein Dongsha4_08800 [Cyanobacterium sp. Dongsha4]